MVALRSLKAEDGVRTPDPEPKYWYYTIFYECPVCGSGPVRRERRYTPKPTEWKDREEYFQRYDYCNAY